MKNLPFYYFLFLCFLGLAGAVEFHPRYDFGKNVSVNFESKDILIKAPILFTEYMLHPSTELCFESHLNDSVTVKLREAKPESDVFDYFVLGEGLTLLQRHSNNDWSEIVRDGLNVTLTSPNKSVKGELFLKWCRKDTYAFLNGSTTSAIIPYEKMDSTIHVPFFVLQSQNATRYVDFSTILPRRMSPFRDWQKKAFCMNTTINGKVKVHINRCKSHVPFTIDLEPTKDRQIVRYWEDFVKLNVKCPPEEEGLPDHLWMEIESIDHSGVGEVVVYNCYHTWVLHETDEEIIKITPSLDREEADHWSFRYGVIPFRKNVYFAPIKHMIDTALVLGSQINFAIIDQNPDSVSVSACYGSTRYTIFKAHQIRNMTLTRDELQLFSDFTNVFNCKEDKPRGLYIHIGAGERQIEGSIDIWMSDRKGAETPQGALRNDRYVTVAFNLQRGGHMCKNVHVSSMFKQAATNTHIKLNHYFNTTGLIRLSVSRCKYSPKLKLFEGKGKKSFVMDSQTVEYVMSLYDQFDCLSDSQTIRYEYGQTPNHGIFFHVEALEDAVGYVASYESLDATLMWHQLNEEYSLPPYDFRQGNSLFVFGPKPKNTGLRIKSLIDRARLMPPVSLRFYIDCSGPCDVAFSRCDDDEIIEWKKVVPVHNNTFAALYTFDKEGIDLLHGYADSLECSFKGHSEIYVHVNAQTRISARVEFSLVNGTDLNQVDPYLTSENVKLKEAEFRQKSHIFLVEIGMCLVAIFGMYCARRFFRSFAALKRAARNEMELIPTGFPDDV